MNESRERFDTSKADLNVERIGRVSPEVRRLFQGALGKAIRGAHRSQLLGLDNLPEGPFVLVANHSGGVGMSELLTIAAEWANIEGEERAIAGFAHAFMFSVKPLRQLLESLGCIPTTYEAAAAALGSGVPILVFPGGDFDTLKPVWQAERVNFNGRKGFLKIARMHNVPIVPLGIRGGSYTAPMLVRSEALAKLLISHSIAGYKRAGVSLLGVLVSAGILKAHIPKKAKLLATYAWLASPLVYFPWIPARLTFRIGTPLTPDELFDGSDNELEKALTRVESEVETLVHMKHPSR